jgi:hypothetical protein
MVLISDAFDERVVMLNTTATSSSSVPAANEVLSATPNDDDDDSPLLLRRDVDKSVLYGGEEIMLAVTEVPLRSVRGRLVKPGYVLATNYRMVFFPASSLKTQEKITHQVLLDHLTDRVASSYNSFPLRFVRMVKSQLVTPFDLNDRETDFFEASVSSTMLRIVLVDGRVLSWEIAHTHLARNQRTAETLVQLLERTQTKPFAFSFKVGSFSSKRYR